MAKAPDDRLHFFVYAPDNRNTRRQLATDSGLPKGADRTEEAVAGRVMAEWENGSCFPQEVVRNVTTQGWIEEVAHSLRSQFRKGKQEEEPEETFGHRHRPRIAN